MAGIEMSMRRMARIACTTFFAFPALFWASARLVKPHFQPEKAQSLP
jgi:hypothetical protein